MNEYPDYLPCPLRRNYGIQHVDPMVRTEMSTGRARQRRAFQYVPCIVTIEWNMSPENAMLFEAWFKYDITDGAEWFLCPLKTPLGYRQYECRFTGIYDGPTYDAASRWNFSAEVELRERQILSEEWYRYGQEFISGMSIIDLALNREYPEP